MRHKIISSLKSSLLKTFTWVEYQGLVRIIHSFTCMTALIQLYIPFAIKLLTRLLMQVSVLIFIMKNKRFIEKLITLQNEVMSIFPKMNLLLEGAGEGF